MNHYLLTRAVYFPGLWPLEANRRRLALFSGVTVRSLAAQTVRDWVWVLAVAADDELRGERLAAAEAAGVEVRALEVPPLGERATRARAAMAAYRAPWAEVAGPGPRLTTRLDDDDAFTPDAFARIRGRLGSWVPRRRVSLMLPVGFRVWGGRYTRVHHASNAMATLYTPEGDAATVYGFMHRNIAEHVEVLHVDQDPGWLWVRHPDTLSGWRRSTRPVSRGLIARFPIDWSVVGTRPVVEPVEGGDRFR